jgi:N-acetylmuramic acid 6-phosphate etherase
MKYNEFKKLSDQFQLGSITTEKFHSKSKNLSHDSVNNLSHAIKTLKEIDQDAFSILKGREQELYQIYERVSSIKNDGASIFLCGCGATGRLSLAIETLALQLGIKTIKAFMAGGDYALIKSVESFEDKMDYGKRQLEDLGFTNRDLLIAITEGGETSFVIGAALRASELSKNNPLFLYCNPDNEINHLERCNQVLKNDRIEKVNLTVGAMALSGSTRMQASTIQMYVAGLFCLNDFVSFEEFSKYIKDSLYELQGLEYEKLKPFIESETLAYKSDNLVTYKSSQDLAISVLTDTTERSPTFSLAPFENDLQDTLSLCYLVVEGALSSKEAWKKMLGRAPRSLDWGKGFERINLQHIYAFDISENSIKRRSSSLLESKKNLIFSISDTDTGFEFDLTDSRENFELKSRDILLKHICLKVLLNTHSTLVMGRLNRYESNIMTWVKPSNFKLIDRASRYAHRLLDMRGVVVSYDDILNYIYHSNATIDSEESIVLKTVREFS